MKTLLLFSLLLSVNVFSQNHYILQKGAIIYDHDNGEFLTTLLKDDTVFVQHFDVAGNLIWEDFLPNSSSISPVYFGGVARFKNTNEYIIGTFVDPTPITPHWDGFFNDVRYSTFRKLDLGAHAFEDTHVDTFSCKGTGFVEINDTTIYLMVSDLSLGVTPFYQATYSLNPSMEISFIAHRDSVETNPWGWTTEFFDDTIYKHQSIDDYHILDKYSFQMSNVQSVSTNLLTSEDNHTAYYKRIYNSDSLFVFTQGTPSWGYTVKWRMDWLDLSLNSLNSTIFNSPITNQSPYRYTSDYFKSAIDRTNRKIIILATHGNTFDPDIPQKLFIYDFNFNFICEMPVTIGTAEENKLIELNGLVYLRNDNSLNSELFRIDCSVSGLEEITANTEFELFPNPTQSGISISNPDKKTLSITVFSTDGKQLLKSVEQESLISLELNNLPDGMYLVEISGGSRIEIKRIIKE